MDFDLERIWNANFNLKQLDFMLFQVFQIKSVKNVPFWESRIFFLSQSIWNIWNSGTVPNFNLFQSNKGVPDAFQMDFDLEHLER